MLVQKLVARTDRNTTIEIYGSLSVLLKAKQTMRQPGAVIELGATGGQKERRSIKSVEYQYYDELPDWWTKARR